MFTKPGLTKTIAPLSFAVKVELAVMQMLEVISARASMHEAFKQLLVAGNVLLYVGDFCSPF